MSQTDQFIAGLEMLKEGERSLLRRLAGKPLDEALQGFDLFTGLWWSLREQSPRAPERRSAWLVAKLYGAFPIPHVSDDRTELASALGHRERALSNEFDRKRFRRRFDALLQSPLATLEPHLHCALASIKDSVSQHKAEGLDWARLLDDLRLWGRGPDKQDQNRARRTRDVRDVWAETYLKAFTLPKER
jgi:CRISPR type I-E-associated protein CasB/Cse2